MPVASDTPSAKSSTEPSIEMSLTRGMLPALSVWIGRIARYASSSPTLPPARARTTLSESICSTSRRAPGAERGANGDLLAAHRCAHQQQIGDVGAGDQDDDADGGEQRQQRRADAGDHAVVQADDLGRLVRAGVRDTAPPAARRSSSSRRRPAATVTPGFSRAITPRKCPPRVGLAGSASGRQNSASDMNANPGRHHADDGHRHAAERDRSDRGSSRSPPNRRCHMPWLRMMTVSLPGASSSARNVRPSAGVTCKQIEHVPGHEAAGKTLCAGRADERRARSS